MSSNPRRAIFERLAFVTYLVLLVGSCGLTALGLIFGLHARELGPAILGAAGLVVAVAVRPYGYRHLHFEDWEDSFEPADAGAFFALNPEHEDRAQHLRGLLREFAAMHRNSAAGEVDIWEVQQLRHRVSDLLEADPVLREEFADELAGHPEI